jgi:hypothetical protein
MNNRNSEKNIRTLRSQAAFGGMLLALAVVGCSQGSMEEAGALEAEREVGELGQSLIAGCSAIGNDGLAHACTHGSLGPFASRVARTAATYDTFAATHTYYNVTFTDGVAPYVGRIDYTPSATSDYAIYFNPSLTVTVKRDSNGATVNPLLDKSMSSCSFLSGYRVFPLTGSVKYRIEITSASTTPVKVLLEDLTDASSWWYKDMDGDFWGDSSQKQFTPCVPDAPYTVKQGTDCNEANAAINPGATETMSDGIDSNCNGNDNN